MTRGDRRKDILNQGGVVWGLCCDWVASLLLLNHSERRKPVRLYLLPSRASEFFSL